MPGKQILTTESAPEIIMNPDGIITIRGRSMNGNINELKGQIDDWIDKYMCSPAEVTYVNFCLEYFNKVNSGVFRSLLKKIGSLSEINKKFIINWYFEEGDEDILEKGEYLSAVVNIPFNFIEVYDAFMPGYIANEEIGL